MLRPQFKTSSSQLYGSLDKSVGIGSTVGISKPTHGPLHGPRNILART